MTMLKRILAVTLSAAMIGAVLTGCSNDKEPGAESKMKLTFLNSKGEIQDGLEAVAKEYKKKTGVDIEILVAPAGTSPSERFSQLYNSGTPPTMSMLDTTDVVDIGWDKAVDLTGEKWVADAGNQAYRINDKVYSFPMGVEGRGLIYNKTAIEKTLGKTFDPKEYNTMDKLKALLEELKSKGMATPVVISKEDWSLGSHYFGYLYITQSDDEGASAAYIDKLKKGEIDLKNDKRFNQLLDTFDLLRSYNINGKAPLDAKYEVDPSYVVDGEAAFWFNGNWAWPNMKEFVTADNKNEFGLMILPLGNDASDFVNTKMLGTASKQIIIDKTKTSEEEQKAAKDFLNWLVYDEAGQKGMVETLQLVPAFSNIKLEPTDPLGKALKVYVDEGKTSPDCIVPADHWSKVGAAMQQYLAGKSTREQLAAKVLEYWKSKA